MPVTPREDEEVKKLEITKLQKGDVCTHEGCETRARMRVNDEPWCREHLEEHHGITTSR